MYPIMIDLSRTKVLVIGAGNIGARKIEALIRAGAKPYVLAPKLSTRLRPFVDQGKMIWWQRAFQVGDTKDFSFIFICTNDTQVNAQIRAELTETQWFNDTTQHEYSNFYSMATLVEEQYTVAVSTEGNNPRLAKQVCQKLRSYLTAEQTKKRK